MSLPVRTSSNINASADINNLSAPPIVIATNENYTIEDLSTTLLDVLVVTTGNTHRTVTLPTASANNNRELSIIKADSGTGIIIIDGEGAEAINGLSTYSIGNQYGAVKLKCNGSNWYVLNDRYKDFYRVRSGMSSSDIIALFDEAQAVKNRDITIQIDDASYTLSANYTFSNMGRIRILGNSADTGNGSSKAVTLSLSTYRLFFTDCVDVEWRYIKTTSSDNSGNGLFGVTNAKVRMFDCYTQNTLTVTGRVADVNKGGYFHLQDTTCDGFDEVAYVGEGTCEYGYGNALANNDTDPYFNVGTLGLVIDRNGSLVESDANNGYVYNAQGSTTDSSVVRGGRYKGQHGGDATWEMSMYPTDASSTVLADYEEGTWTPTLYADGTNFTSVTYDAITSGYYVKIGRMCFLQGTIRTDAITVGSASGNLHIGGLPFASATGASQQGYASVTIGRSSAWVTNPNGGDVTQNASDIALYKRTTLNGDSASMVYTDANTGADKNLIRFSVAYRTVS